MKEIPPNYTQWKKTAEVLSKSFIIPNADTEDVKQELILAQWKASRIIAPDNSKSEKAYYVTAAKNALYSIYRRQTAQKRDGGTRISLDEIQIGIEYRTRINAADLIELSQTPLQRRIARFIIQNGLSVAETAKRLKIAETAVKTEMRKLYLSARKEKII